MRSGVVFAVAVIVVLTSSLAFAAETPTGSFGPFLTLGLLTLAGAGRYGVARAPSLRDQLDELAFDFRAALARSAVGRYWRGLYETPVGSERALGVFFFWKTAILTAIAFHSQDPVTLALLLAFCSGFDAATGVYQHTIMNFCHRSFFRSRVLATVENLARRFAIDLFRAEVITLIVLGSGFLTLENQGHVVVNRLVSGSYYFNAVYLDKLVASGALCRNFRTRFIIFASTLGSLLCTLDLARTRAPEWFPRGVVAAVSWMPGPLDILMGFNFVVLVAMAGSYFCYRARRNGLQ